MFYVTSLDTQENIHEFIICDTTEVKSDGLLEQIRTCITGFM